MRNNCIAVQLLSYGVLLVFGMDIINPGPKYVPTKGEVWPRPQQEFKKTTFYKFDPTYFTITVPQYYCDILSDAIERYSYIFKQSNYLSSRNRKIKSRETHPAIEDTVRVDNPYKGFMTELKIVLTAPCEEYPSFGMDEMYSLKVSSVSILESASIWGVLRGLETFTQLLYFSTDYNVIWINETSINDYPSYPHRGLLLDTARHYIAVGNILKTLDAMAMNKMNVFHWHIVDDQSFPYQSEKFPELSNKGAFHSSMVYTKEDIERIVQYARARGIRVIPEFDIPGHTRSWGSAYPNILTQCYSTDGKTLGAGLGPMDPLSNETLYLLNHLLLEVRRWFPDKSFHVGGDEVDLDCWSSNPRLTKYMNQHGISANGLHALFMTNAISLLGNDTDVIVWQDVFDNSVPLTKGTVVQVWKNWAFLEIISVLLSGYRVLFSTEWYLSELDKEWSDFYKSDPIHLVRDLINGTLLQNFIGGEACMWGEMVDDRNVISRVWPRASAVAEKLWNPNPISGENTAQSDVREEIPDDVYHRIEEHACRMIRRGIDSQPPSGPGFCVV